MNKYKLRQIKIDIKMLYKKITNLKRFKEKDML